MSKLHPTDSNTRQIIDMWYNENSADFKYYDKAEQFNLGFWAPGGTFRQRFDKLNCEILLEIASGKGRHAAQIVNSCGRLILTDTSFAAVEHLKKRFAGNSNVAIFLIEDGRSLPFVADSSVTGVFSYDSMVHFEALTVAAYLSEINRILVPGGMAFLHHSNYDRNPENLFHQNPGWRNYMSEDLFRHFASRARLRVLEYVPMNWAEENSDAISLLQKPSKT